jgi:hypothetical protein
MHRIPDRLQHSDRVLEHIIVPKPQHANAARGEGALAPLVVGLLPGVGMLPTIQLDGKPRFRAKEVQDVAAEWMLAAELESSEPPIPQASPQFRLGVHRLSAHVARPAEDVRREANTLVPPLGSGGFGGFPLCFHVLALGTCCASHPRGGKGTLTLALSPGERGQRGTLTLALSPRERGQRGTLTLALSPRERGQRGTLTLALSPGERGYSPLSLGERAGVRVLAPSPLGRGWG